MNMPEFPCASMPIFTIELKGLLTMKPFTNQLDLTAFLEGFSSNAYQDIAGVWTIGFGQARNLPDGTRITKDMTCTEEQTRKWLTQTMEEKSYSIRYHYPIFGNQLDAITDYCYNVGLGKSPKLCKALLDKDFENASKELLNAIYVNYKPILGLLLRRISEYNTFLTGQYIAFEKNDPITSDLKNNLLKMNQSNKEAIKMINTFKVK